MKCQSWVRRTGEACDHPAKYGILWVSQVKQGHGHKATDGRFVKIDNYACGHHLGRRRASKISIEHLNGTPDHDDLVALARYEEDLARQAKREEAFLRDYEQSVARTPSRSTTP